MKKQIKLAANNKKAYHDYFVDETYEAGIVLTGTEIKSIRQGKVSIKEAYVRIRNGEAIVMGMNISPYEQGNRFNVDPLRDRKLLLHKQEIRKLTGKLTLQGMTLIPLKLYINEDVSVIPADRENGVINAYVGITIANVAGANGANPTFGGTDIIDWHMFATPLQAAPLGIDYHGDNTAYHGSMNGYDYYGHYGPYYRFM